MPSSNNIGFPPVTRELGWFRSILHWITRYAAIEIAIALALAIAAYFLGRHLFDLSVPIEGDVRSHIFKIEILQSYLAHFSWPQWNPYWYHGIPEDQFYPPGFYFLGALLSFFISGVVAYKILLLITLMLNGVIIYFFSRRFLKFDSHLAIWCLIVYETSTPLILNFMYGEGPNLLGWSVTLGFLTIYLSQAIEGNTHRLINIIVPGLLLGVAILIHPFPVIFAAMVIVVFNIIWLIHKRHWKTYIKSQVPYLIGITLIAALIGMYYWLPAFLTLHYSSPIYSFTKYQWPGGTLYLLVIVFIAIAVAIVTRFRVLHDPRLDTVIISFFLACALGFGATSYLPFGLGSLVQEFRFAAIVIPFFGILLALYPLKYNLINLNWNRLAIALVFGLFLTAFVFGLNQREAFISGYKDITNPGFMSLYKLAANKFSASFPGFAVTIFPYFVVMLFLALSISRNNLVVGKSKPVFILAAGACLILLTSFIPYINTDKSAGLNRLYEYTGNYLQPYYAQIMKAAQNGRLIIPMNKGYLTEGDNPVTFARRWGVETVNGPYNQGDPKFFKFTVHLEWEERWLNFPYTRENLMQESAAKYIFIRDAHSLPSNLTGLVTTVDVPYGKILELNQNISYADKVTPILMDVTKSRELTEFLNILLPGGYKIVLVDIKDAKPDLINKFDYVIVDKVSKTAGYPAKEYFYHQDHYYPQ